MKRILINATHAEEIRVALCNGSHLYDFDLENRTREQKKANIYKGRVTRVEPSLEAVFVEYGSARQGFLPIREIASEYLSGDPRSSNIKNIIKEGDELIVQVEKEERGNKGAALSTLISLAGRYLVLMPNNARGGGISRQISGKLREEMKQALADLQLPKGMSVIIRTAGIGKTSEDLQHDLDHLLGIWQGIQQQNQKYPAPRLVHQEAGVVTRAVRDYLRDDITEIWIDNENAYNEAANFIEAVMPQQLSKLRKYTNYEPMFARFGIEKQIETAYQREVRLPSGGSIVIDQTEALVAIDINSSKSTKGADVSETAFNTNLEAADEIARQLRLRDMGGLIVIDFIDMATDEHQKQVENRIKEATKNDRARIQFAEISRFGLFEMSRQRLRPSLGEATGFLCPRCHGTGMIRDLRSLALSIMRQIEQKALQEREGEVQADVPTEIAAFLLNEKRDSLVYLEQESGTRITILPHAHLESPNFTLTYNREGFAPSSYERVSESEQHENKDRGYDTSDWHTDDNEVSRVTRPTSNKPVSSPHEPNDGLMPNCGINQAQPQQKPTNQVQSQPVPTVSQPAPQSSAVAWLSNLFAPTQQAQVAHSISSQDAAAAIESIVNTGAKSLGVHGHIQAVSPVTVAPSDNTTSDEQHEKNQNRRAKNKKSRYNDNDNSDKAIEKSEKFDKNDSRQETAPEREKPQHKSDKPTDKSADKTTEKTDSLPKREPNSRRDSRGEKQRREALIPPTMTIDAVESITQDAVTSSPAKADRPTRKDVIKEDNVSKSNDKAHDKASEKTKAVDPNQVNVQVHKSPASPTATTEAVHLSLDDSKPQTEPKFDTTNRSQSVVANQAETVQADIVQTQVAAETVLSAEPVEAALSQLVHNTPSVESTQTLETRPTLDVTPTQGRAKNDPREVYRTYSEQFGDTLSNAVAITPAPITSMNKISGTVGQFITTQLGQMAQGDTVSQFIQAIEQFKHSHHASQADDNKAKTDDSHNAALNSQAFGQFFRNYGYQAISHDSVNSYHQMIRPQGQFRTVAGTSYAMPAPVAQRASNDPRGQTVKPTLSKPTLSETASSKATVSDTATTTQNPPIVTEPNQQAVTVNAVAHAYPHASVGAWIVEQLGEQGHTLIEQGQLVHAYLLAYQQPHANNLSLDSHVTDKLTEHGVAVSKQTTDIRQLDDESHLPSEGKPIKMRLSQPVENVNTLMNPIENHQEDDSTDEQQQNKGKTTPTSYKNMIESVAEQLKPTVGSVLNLPVPKVPKARTRKPKATEKPVAKPKTRTSKKVENAVIVKKTNTKLSADIANDDSNSTGE